MNWFIKWYWLDLWKNKPGVWPNAWGWIRLILPYQKLFYESASMHDKYYTLGWNILDKNRADIQFLKGCLNASNSTLSKCFAYLYFYSVYIFWFLFYFWK